MNEFAYNELKKIFNGRFSTSESTRANYARGEDTYEPVLSKAVIFPETNEEVSKILKLCNDHKIPVVPFGTGTSLEGNVVGNSNGIKI
jgi:D-lactate dehydrogenase (cytochrome)